MREFYDNFFPVLFLDFSHVIFQMSLVVDFEFMREFSLIFPDFSFFPGYTRHAMPSAHSVRKSRS